MHPRPASTLKGWGSEFSTQSVLKSRSGAVRAAACEVDRFASAKNIIRLSRSLSCQEPLAGLRGVDSTSLASISQQNLLPACGLRANDSGIPQSFPADSRAQGVVRKVHP